MKKPKFSIRYKFLSVTTALLILCVGGYLFLATEEFKTDKKSLVFDYNQSLVSGLSGDLDNTLASVTDRLRMIAYFYREHGGRKKSLIQDLLRGRHDLVWVAGSEKFSEVEQVFFTDEKYLGSYGLKDAELTAWIAGQKIPFEEIKIRGQYVWRLSEDLPLLGYGRTIVEEDENGVPVRQMAMVAFVRAERFLKLIEDARPNEMLVVGAQGEPLLVLGVGTGATAGVTGSQKTNRLFELAKESPVRRKVFEFTEGEESYLAAYAQALSGQIFVLSKISEKKAFRAVDRLVFRSLLVASMIVTLAFLVAIFFSRSLTRPLDVLIQGMHQVSDGDLKTHIDVKSKDEMALLAASFNRMIQDLKKSREELEEINRDLENKVQIRTKELEMQNRAVKEAQEALLRTTRLAAAGEVAGQAAHEVLNPLTTIVARLQKLKKRVGEERGQDLAVLDQIRAAWQKDYAEGGFTKLVKSWQTPSGVKPGVPLWQEDLENIEAVGRSVQAEFKNLISDTDFLLEETERIQKIINSFRSLSTARGEPEPYRARDLCERSLRIMADLAQKENVRLETDFTSGMDVVSVDADEFLQVMTNLIRNAIQSVSKQHAGAPGKGWVKISTRTVSSAIEILIADNGLGITEEVKKHLFEKHFTTKSKSEGTGIGLSISRRLIRAFEGNLALRDGAPGKGATFVIVMPLTFGSGIKTGAAS